MNNAIVSLVLLAVTLTVPVAFGGKVVPEPTRYAADVSVPALEAATPVELPQVPVIDVPEITISVPTPTHVAPAPRAKVFTCGPYHEMLQGPVRARVQDCEWR